MTWSWLQLQNLFLIETCVGKQRAKLALSLAQFAKEKEQHSQTCSILPAAQGKHNTLALLLQPFGMAVAEHSLDGNTASKAS